MLPLHAVPSWCTLSVSTSAVLDVFSLGYHSSLQPRALLWSGDQGSGARSCLCHVEELMLPSWAGTTGHASQQDEEESSESRSCSHRQVPGSRKKPGVCFRERVQPNLTNPSCTDVLPLFLLPGHSLRFFPRSRVQRLWEARSSEWPLAKPNHFR